MTNLVPVPEIMAASVEHHALERNSSWAEGAAYIIDGFVPIGQAAVPISDLGFVRGDAVYDVVSVSRGRFFRLEDHQNRFAGSCGRMSLRSPFSREAEAALLNALVARTGLKDAYVWWSVTRGRNPERPADRLHADRFANRLYAFAVPYVFIKDDADRQAGINLHISRDYIRIPAQAVDPRAKNFNSLDLSMALMEAGGHGADWTVLSDGSVALTEAPGSNVFVVKDGRIHTPERGCLEGITRTTVGELCQTFGMEVMFGRVIVDDLMSADEAFLTSSAGGILPVSKVDGKVLCGRAGPVSTRIHNLYWKKRREGWHGYPVDYEATE